MWKEITGGIEILQQWFQIKVMMRIKKDIKISRRFLSTKKEYFVTSTLTSTIFNPLQDVWPPTRLIFGENTVFFMLIFVGYVMKREIQYFTLFLSCPSNFKPGTIYKRQYTISPICPEIYKLKDKINWLV